MVQSSSLDKKLIWTYVKHLKIKYLIKNIDLTCEFTENFIPLDNMKINLVSLSKMIGRKSSNEIVSNLSKSDINFGAKLFIALNSCPSFYEKLYWKVIYGNKSRIANFAANIIRKAKDDFKVRAQKIFAKISSMLGFKHITYNHNGERTSKNILEIEGEELSTSIENSF